MERPSLGQWRSSVFHVRGPRLEVPTAATIIAVLLGTVIVCSIVAWDGTVPGWERAGLEFFNDWPDWLEPGRWVVQQPGVLLFPCAVGGVVALASRRWHYAVPFAILPIYKLLLEKGVVKSLVERARPFTSIGPEITARGSAGLEEASFPSGHTTTAVATGLLVAAFLPKKWRPLPILWGLAVGIARLYYGEHNVLDVVAGAALGGIFATLASAALINRWVGDGPVPRGADDVVRST